MTSVGPGGPGATRDALLAELHALLEERMDAARGRERALLAEVEDTLYAPTVRRNQQRNQMYKYRRRRRRIVSGRRRVTRPYLEG